MNIYFVWYNWIILFGYFFLMTAFFNVATAWQCTHFVDNKKCMAPCVMIFAQYLIWFIYFNRVWHSGIYFDVVYTLLAQKCIYMHVQISVWDLTPKSQYQQQARAVLEHSTTTSCLLCPAKSALETLWQQKYKSPRQMDK